MSDVHYPCKHGAQVFCGSCETAHRGDRGAVNAILDEHLKPTTHNHLRAVDYHAGTKPLEDALVNYCETVRADALYAVRRLHWPSPDRDPACNCYDGLQECPTIAALRLGVDESVRR